MTFSFFPSAAAASALTNTFELRLKDALKELVQQVHESDPALFPVSLVRAIERTDAHDLNGFHSAVYHEVIRLLNEGDLDASSLLLFEIISPRYVSLPLRLSAEDVDPKLLQMILDQAVHGTTHKGIRLKSVSRAQGATAFTSLARGLEILEQACPDIAQEHHRLIKNIVLFESGGQTSERALSFTGNRCQSLILINGQFDPGWIFLLDKLVHETAHAYIFAINLQEEMVLNEEGAIYKSPLRKDVRNMSAIYHATFVIQRLIYAFTRVAASGLVSGADRSRIKSLLDYYQGRVDDAYALVIEKGILSRTARALLDEGQRCVLDLRQSVC